MKNTVFLEKLTAPIFIFKKLFMLILSKKNYKKWISTKRLSYIIIL